MNSRRGKRRETPTRVWINLAVGIYDYAHAKLSSFQPRSSSAPTVTSSDVYPPFDTLENATAGPSSETYSSTLSNQANLPDTRAYAVEDPTEYFIDQSFLTLPALSTSQATQPLYALHHTRGSSPSPDTSSHPIRMLSPQLRSAASSRTFVSLTTDRSGDDHDQVYLSSPIVNQTRQVRPIIEPHVSPN